MAREAKQDEAGLTQRVVVKQERVIVVPAGAAAESVEALVKAANTGKQIEDEHLKALRGVKVGEAWVELGPAEGDKPEAIATYAGEKGSPDAVPGLYRAPTQRSWKDGQLYKPPVQRVDAETVE